MFTRLCLAGDPLSEVYVDVASSAGFPGTKTVEGR